MVLGGGPNRIGQGIEFDYCCVHAAFALREDGYETIMVNCNPETVSTDYDTSDRLYFEPLTLEDVLEIVAQGKPEGRDRAVRRADAAEAGARIWRRPVCRSSAPARTRSIWPKTASVSSSWSRSWACSSRPTAPRDRARAGGDDWPTRSVIRWWCVPSYVLGGRAMEIVHDERRSATLHARGGARSRTIRRCCWTVF